VLGGLSDLARLVREQQAEEVSSAFQRDTLADEIYSRSLSRVRNSRPDFAISCRTG